MDRTANWTTPPAPTGRKATLIAALIPDGYRVSSADNDRFFACPVRGCRGEFFSIHGVDMHFFVSRIPLNAHMT